MVPLKPAEGETWHEVDNSWPTHKQNYVPAQIGCQVTRNIQYIVENDLVGTQRLELCLQLLFLFSVRF